MNKVMSNIDSVVADDTVRGMSRLLGNAMSALVLVCAAALLQQPVVVCEFCR